MGEETQEDFNLICDGMEECNREMEKLLEEMIGNEELILFGKPIDQGGADEPRYEVVISGPERLMKAFIELF
jgi:hypothetical protein